MSSNALALFKAVGLADPIAQSGDLTQEQKNSQDMRKQFLVLLMFDWSIQLVYVCMYVCMYTLVIEDPSRYWFD